MSKNVYDIFRGVQNKRTNHYNTRSAAFIEEGKLAKIAYHRRLKKKIKIGLTYRYKEGPDEVIVYSYNEDDLYKGDYIIYDNVNYLIYEDYKLIDDNLNHKKQNAVECNVSFNFAGNIYQGYFVSTLRRHNNESFEGRQLLAPDENPLLMLPKNDELTINSEFLIEGKPWRIKEFDHITNKGITYYYLERGIIENIDKEAEPDWSSLEKDDILEPLIPYTFETVDGLFSSNPPVQVIQKRSDSVKFRIPYGIDKVMITTALFEDKVFKVVK